MAINENKLVLTHAQKRQEICENLGTVSTVGFVVCTIFAAAAISCWMKRLDWRVVVHPSISSTVSLTVISAVSGVSAITALVARIILGRTKRVEIKPFDWLNL